MRKESKHSTKQSHQWTGEESKRRGTRKQQIGNKEMPINSYFKCKWTKFPNQKTQSR